MERGDTTKTKTASHRDSIVWQKAIALVEQVYALSKMLPKSEQYGLIDQMTRAAVSIPANIAERNARESRRDYAHFVSIAKGSQAETETYLVLLVRLGFVTQERVESVAAQREEVGRMLTGLRRSLEQ